jgi:arylsulfatase A-like enzyme
MEVADGFQSPNIVFMMADDIGYTDVGYMGTDLKDTTPVIDTLAADGIKMSTVYGGIGCTPGRAAAMTGRYPMRMGMQKGAINTLTRKSVPLNNTMLSIELKHVGYATAMIGKWHLGHASWSMTPLQRGFDYYYGFLCSGAIDFQKKTNGDYFDMYKTVAGAQNCEPEMDASMMDESVRTSTLYEMGAIYFIQQHKAKGTAQPFFMYWAHQDPHTPLSAPEDFTETWPCSDFGDSTRKTYCGMMRSLDTNVESLMVALTENDYVNNTLIVFTGDNGGAPKNGGYNYPLRGSKGTIFEGGIRQVTWMWGSMIPSQLRGTTSDLVFSHTDFLPSLMSAATAGLWSWSTTLGYEPDGLDQWPTLMGLSDSYPKRNITLLNCIDQSGGIRMGDYVLLLNIKDDDWYPQPSMDGTFPVIARNDTERLSTCSDNVCNYLFDVVTDPNEYTNLYSSMPDKVAEMQPYLEELWNEAVDYNVNETKEDAATAQAASTGYWGPWLE